MISFEDFSKIELKAGKVIKAEKIEGSEKLLRIHLDLGSETRELVSGIAKTYAPDDLIGKELIIVANLEPKTIMGIESHGMILATRLENGAPAVIIPEREILPGASVG